MFLNGSTIKEIAKCKNTTNINVYEILIELGILVEYTYSGKILGHKSEAYYKTEDEQLHLPTYTYNDLSPQEKIIYESRED